MLTNEVLGRLPAAFAMVLCASLGALCTDKNDTTEGGMERSEESRYAWNARRFQGTFFSSLPFGWLTSATGFTTSGLGISYMHCRDGNSVICPQIGANFLGLQFARYRLDKDVAGNDDEVYRSTPLRFDLGAVSGYKRVYANFGAGLCVPFLSSEFLASSQSPKGISARYWQGYVAIGFRVAEGFDLGIRVNRGITDFDAGNGKGRDNNVAFQIVSGW